MIKRFLLFLLFAPVLSALEPIAPIPKQLDDVDIAKAKLGRMLYLDPLLSSDRNISCHSCHNFDYGSADPNVVSQGVYGRKGDIQSPPIFNSRYNFKQFWNGRATDLREQVSGPLFNHAEMNMTPEEVEARLNKNQTYLKLFDKVYGATPITFENVTDAIVEFEKALIVQTLEKTKWVKNQAAKLLQLNRTTLVEKIKRYELQKCA